MFNTQLKENTEHLLLLHEYGVDVKDRTVYLMGEFGGDCDSVEMTLANLRHLSSPSHYPEDYLKPIKMVIDSPGGEDVAMFHLYDFIRAVDVHICSYFLSRLCSSRR